MKMMEVFAEWLQMLLTFSLLVATPSFVLVESHEEVTDFITEFPQNFEFSNSTGGQLPCKANGFINPTWLLSDGSPISNVNGLRHVSHEGTLVFPPFKAEDYRQDVHSVTYRCSISTPSGTIVSPRVQVKGIVIQSFDIHVYDVYAMKENSVVMKCHIPEFLEKYVSVVAWIKDSVVQISPAKFHVDSKYIVLSSGDLYVRNVTLDDDMTVFRCQATHRLTGETKTSVNAGRLIVTEPKSNIPPKISATSSVLNVKQGTNIFVPCIVQGNPVPSCDWSRQTNDGEVTRIKSSKHLSQFSESLLIEDSLNSDTGVYICTARNPVGTDSIAIQINVAEPIIIKIVPNEVQVNAGQSITLKCEILSNIINNIYWIKDGHPLPIDGIHQPNNQTIHISSMHSKHAGIYQCFASNYLQEAYSTAVIKIGDSSPEIVEFFNENILRPNEPLSLECIAKGNPKPEIIWTVNTIEIKNDNHRKIENATIDHERTKSRLSIDKIRTEDGGLIRCIAKNTAGRTQHQARINVYGEISVLYDIKIHAIAEDTIQIPCPFYGFPYKAITWKKGNVNLPDNMRQAVFPNGLLQIKNIHKRKDSGKVTCIVTNQKEATFKTDIEIIVMVPPKISPFSFQDEQIREGTRARIQCVVSEGEAPLVLKWLKDGRPIPSELGVTIRDLDEFSSILMITAITPRHNGNYSCVASNAAGQAQHTALLFVNVPPKILPFAFQDDQFFKGMRAYIVCALSQGDSPVHFTWLKDGKTLPLHLGVITRNIDQHANSLSIESVSSQHTGNYTCIVSNKAGKTHHTAELLVHVVPRIIPFAFRGVMFEGGIARITCTVDQGDLPIRFQWMKDSRYITGDQRITIKTIDEYSSMLTIDNVNQKHSGNYSCLASNAAATVTYTASLVVHVPPEWLIVPEDVSARIRERVLLHCQAKGFPQPHVTWKKATGLVLDESYTTVENNEDINIFPNGSLLFRKISKSDEGYYYCVANNDIGDPISKVVTVKIRASPVFKVKQRELLARKGDSVKIPCQADGDLPISYKWMVNNLTIDSSLTSQRYKITEITQDSDNQKISELSITWVDKKDSVVFMCEAINSIGKSEMSVKILVQEPPEAPVLYLPISVRSQELKLRWSVPYDGNNPITKFILQYKKQADKWDNVIDTLAIGGNQTEVTTRNLLPATSYTFRILAENHLGNSSFSEEVNKKTEESLPTGSPQNVQVESIDAATLRVTWSPPMQNTWNGVIRGYMIGYKKTDSFQDYHYKKLEVPEDYHKELIYQLVSLEKYAQYTVIIQAYNSIGKSPSSEPVIAMTSESVPSAPPQKIRCSTLSSKSIYVLWEAPPIDSMNGILRGYKVLYKSASEWYDATQLSKTTDIPKISLQDLEVNTNYSIQIAAFTKIGDGVKSEAVFCKTLEDVPEPPVDVKVLPSSSDSVVISWKPSKKNKSSIIKYNVYYKSLEKGEEIDLDSPMTEQFARDAKVHSSKEDIHFLEVNGLQKNKKYIFWVTSNSVIGESLSSVIVAQTVADSIVPAKSASFDDSIKIPWKKDVILPCITVGTPTPQRKWSFENKPVIENGHVMIRPDGAIVISKATNEDSGSYVCAVYNEHGRDETKYTLNVLTPPSAPKVDIISKTKSSIQLQWKTPMNGGDPIKGYLLHYKKEGEPWTTKELRPEYGIFAIDELVCGATYQIFMEAFNYVGTGEPSDVITVSTEGANAGLPSKSELIKESSSFVTVHLDSWPSTGCPVQYFGIEYKALSAKEWTVIGSNISPSQKKMVISGLSPATWYMMKLIVEGIGGTDVFEYTFATLSVSGETISSDVYDGVKPVYVFHLDPLIFVPAMALLIVVIIAAVIVWVFMKRRNESAGAPSEFSLETNPVNTWVRHSRYLPSDYGYTGRSSTLSRRTSKDPCPYATTLMSEYYPENVSIMNNAGPSQANFSGTLRRNIPGRSASPDFSQRSEYNKCHVGNEETTFAFPSKFPVPFSEDKRSADDYDPPPKGYGCSQKIKSEFSRYSPFLPRY